jgi:Cu/Ag efflux pump CusA
VFQALVGFSLRQRIFVLVAMMGPDRLGAEVARTVPIDLRPGTRPPIVVILTEAGGLATEEVEQLVTHQRVRSTTDTFTTLVLFAMFGEKALRRVLAADAQLAYETF